MPVVLEPHRESLAHLLALVPPGAHGTDAMDRLRSWLAHRPDEYAALLGPHVPLDDALALADEMRLSRPSMSVVLVRDAIDTASLKEAMQAGVREVVPTHDHAAIGAAINRAFELHQVIRGPGGALHTGKVITVFSPKGGVGKTTIAVNVALALANKGARRVCLVDFDLAFGDVAITLQLIPTTTIEQAIGAEDSLDVPLVESLLTRHADAVMVLAAPNHPEVRDRISTTLMLRILEQLRSLFDYVVVDTAPSFDEKVLSVLDASDDCVLVTTLDVPTLKNVKVAVESLEALDVASGHRHLVLNRADDQVGLAADKVEAILAMPVTARVATSFEVAAGTNLGRPLYLADPGHPVSRTIDALARQLSGAAMAPNGQQHPAGEQVRKGRFRLRRS